MYITNRENSIGGTLHPFHGGCYYWSQRKEPTHKWPSWHNHTGSFPRFSNCPTLGLSFERYKLDMEINKEAWELFAITDHAHAIAIDVPNIAWPYNWYDSFDIPERCYKAGITEERYRQYVERGDALRDGKKFFSGIEVEVDSQGRHLVPDWVWEHMDVVIGSVHHNPINEKTWVEDFFMYLDRILKLPCDYIGHPVRAISRFSTQTHTLPHEILDEVIKKLYDKGSALEINAHFPQFADDVYLLRRAYEKGMEIAFALDLHYPEEFGNWRYFEDVVEMSGIPYEKLKLFTPKKFKNK